MHLSSVVLAIPIAIPALSAPVGNTRISVLENSRNVQITNSNITMNEQVINNIGNQASQTDPPRSDPSSGNPHNPYPSGAPQPPRGNSGRGGPARSFTFSQSASENPFGGFSDLSGLANVGDSFGRGFPNLSGLSSLGMSLGTAATFNPPRTDRGTRVVITQEDLNRFLEEQGGNMVGAQIQTVGNNVVYWAAEGQPVPRSSLNNQPPPSNHHTSSETNQGSSSRSRTAGPAQGGPSINLQSTSFTLPTINRFESTSHPSNSHPRQSNDVPKKGCCS